jgi:hypothetical protein
MLDIHKDIKTNLEYYRKIQKIPNIIFYGPSGSGKKTVVMDFIKSIYNNDTEIIKNYLMTVNCIQMKGIKLIREDLKFFAKTHIQSNEGHTFKSIVLLNADKLTMDAQSALRRLIELFSHNTRFFIIVEDKYKLLKPIISRFCEMYIPEPIYKGESINLYKYNINKTMKINSTKKVRMEKLKKDITKTGICSCSCESTDFHSFMTIAEKMYEDGYSGLDFIYLLENNDDDFFNSQKITNEKKYSFLVLFHTVKKEIKNEKLLILFILNFIYKDSCFDFTSVGLF